MRRVRYCLQIMDLYPINKLLQDISTQLVTFNYSVEALVKIKLTEDHALVEDQKLSLFIRQNSYTAFIIIKVNE